MSIRSKRLNTRPKPEIKTPSSTLRQVFEEMDRQGVTVSDMGRAVDCEYGTVTDYRVGKHEPRVLMVEAMVAALGMEIKLVPAT